MDILEATEAHLDPWLHLRKQLWPEPDAFHLDEMRAILASSTANAFLMFTPDGKPVGFIEGALYLQGPQHYGYVEGWFVAPEFRRRGFGGQLLGALEEWILHHAITLSLSDTIPEEYPLSPAAHAKHGYRPWRTLQVFFKKLEEQDGE